MELFLFTKNKKFSLLKKGFSYVSILISILLLNIVILIISFSFKSVLSTSVSIADTVEIINYPILKEITTRHFANGEEEDIKNTEKILPDQVISIKKVKYKERIYYFIELDHLRIPAISNNGR